MQQYNGLGPSSPGVAIAGTPTLINDNTWTLSIPFGLMWQNITVPSSQTARAEASVHDLGPALLVPNETTATIRSKSEALVTSDYSGRPLSYLPIIYSDGRDIKSRVTPGSLRPEEGHLVYASMPSATANKTRTSRRVDGPRGEGG